MVASLLFKFLSGKTCLARLRINLVRQCIINTNEKIRLKFLGTLNSKMALVLEFGCFFTRLERGYTNQSKICLAQQLLGKKILQFLLSRLLRHAYTGSHFEPHFKIMGHKKQCGF